LLDDDFSDPIDGSGYVMKIPFTFNQTEARNYIVSFFAPDQTFFRQSTIKTCVVTLSFYIPSQDMLVSVLMETRFD